MMNTEYIFINDYCRKTNIDLTFFELLEDGGLIDVYIENGERYFPAAQLGNLERYSRLYYDLSINIEGIDAIHHLLEHIKTLREEINVLRNKLRLYEQEEGF